MKAEETHVALDLWKGPTAVAIDAVQQLHGLANMVHVSGHAHECEAGRSKERLCMLNASEH